MVTRCRRSYQSKYWHVHQYAASSFPLSIQDSNPQLMQAKTSAIGRWLNHIHKNSCLSLGVSVNWGSIPGTSTKSFTITIWTWSSGGPGVGLIRRRCLLAKIETDPDHSVYIYIYPYDNIYIVAIIVGNSWLYPHCVPIFITRKTSMLSLTAMDPLWIIRKGHERIGFSVRKWESPMNGGFNGRIIYGFSILLYMLVYWRVYSQVMSSSS